jgi:SNF2 family DNA or RNA helicase
MQVLDLHKIPFLWLDGDVPWEKREQIIRKLYMDGNPRLLIFSSVGATGVNMAIADIMIHVVRVLLPVSLL